MVSTVAALPRVVSASSTEAAQQLDLKLLPPLRTPEANLAVYDRIVAPLASERDQTIAAFKKARPWALGTTLLATTVMTALASGQSGMLGLVLAGSAAIGVGSTGLYTVANKLLARPDADREAAKDEAAKAVAEAIGELKAQPWATLIRGVTADANGKHSIKLELDPIAYNKLTANERKALPGRIGESLEASVRKLAPFVKIDVNAVGNAKLITAESAIGTTIAVSIGAPVASLIGMFIGSIIGGGTGLVVSGTVGVATLFSGLAAALISGSETLANSSGELAWNIFQYGTVGMLHAGVAAFGIALPFGLAGEGIKWYRSDKKKFRDEASALLVPFINGSRELLPAEWQARIGAVTIGKDERGYAMIDVRKNGDVSVTPADEADLKAALMAIMPKEMQRLMKRMPVYFDRAPGPAPAKNVFDGVLTLNDTVEKAWNRLTRTKTSEQANAAE